MVTKETKKRNNSFPVDFASEWEKAVKRLREAPVETVRKVNMQHRESSGITFNLGGR